MFTANKAVALACLASIVTLAGCNTCGTGSKGVFEAAEHNRELVQRYKSSIATVKYWIKHNAEGEEPRFEIPYLCPNCSETHWRDDGSSSEKGIPAEFAGFVIGPDAVLVQDLMIEPEFIDRIEIECAGETLAATEVECCPYNNGVILKTEKPFGKAVPLTFSGKTPANPRYFYIVRENGDTVAGVKGSLAAAFAYHVGVDRTIYKGQPNTLVLDENDDPVTVALQVSVELGKETFTSPADWNREAAGRRFEAASAREARLRKAVLPVYVQLEAQNKNEASGRGIMGIIGDLEGENRNDLDALGLVIEDGRVIVPLKLTAAQTARLSKLEATLPDGTKTELRFAGTYADRCAFTAEFTNGLPTGVEPLKLYRGCPLKLFNETVYSFTTVNRGGKIECKRGTAVVDEFSRVKGNLLVPAFKFKTGFRGVFAEDAEGIVLNAADELVSATIKDRQEEGWRGEKSARCGELVAMVDAPAYDLENVPRAAGDRKRTPWLGVEVQVASEEELREKRALSYLDGRFSERYPIVSEVAPGSPADLIGIKPGDVLIAVSYAGGGSRQNLTLERDYASEIDWNEAFANERFTDVANSGELTPWPNAEGGINGHLQRYGVGTEVAVSWVSDGVRKEAKTRLVLAPVHFSNAPRTRSKELGMTVCDMTYEVRKYFKFADRDPGVVIARVKSGGTASVSGLKPLELITEVNGEKVYSAKDFLEKTKGRKELNFSVRRLTATRMVPISL